MSYQTSTQTTSLGREAAAAAAATLGGYSDGRYQQRGDSNQSPVQTVGGGGQTGGQGSGSGQPILAGTAAPYFFAPTAFNAMPNYQFGTMYTVSDADTPTET